MTIDYKLDKKDHRVTYFVGTTYELPRQKIKTLGDLRAWLRAIDADLPEKDDAKIVDLEMHKGELSYTLSDEDSIITE